jgi:ectoine hydroxylase-related dioxygenase (phytanoyl-CoA dioxygenase family)
MQVHAWWYRPCFAVLGCMPYILWNGRSLRPGFAVLHSETSAFAGDLLAHHSLMVHWAPANETLQRRRALGFVYIKASVVPDYERFEEFQRQLATVNSPSAKTA